MLAQFTAYSNVLNLDQQLDFIKEQLATEYPTTDFFCQNLRREDLEEGPSLENILTRIAKDIEVSLHQGVMLLFVGPNIHTYLTVIKPGTRKAFRRCPKGSKNHFSRRFGAYARQV
jgi:hypothetical protein